MKSTSTLLLGSLLAVMAVGSAVAAPVTVKLTGQVDGLMNANGPVLGGQIQMGQPFTATYTYDPDSGDMEPDPEYGSYAPSAAMGAKIKVSIGSWTFESLATSQFTANVSNPASPGLSEHFSLQSYPNKPLPSGASVSFITLSLFDSDGTALSSDALPATAPDVQAFAYRKVEIHGSGSNSVYEIYLDIETAEIVPPAIDISPASGFLLTQQNFDAALLLPVGAEAASLQASVNGTPLALDLSSTCQSLILSTGDRPAILCPDAHAALASFTGVTTVDWQVTLTDGTVLTRSVDWDLIP